MQKRTVGPDTVRMLQLGHPWVIEDSYTKKWPKGQAGDLVQLVDEQGRPLAVALLDPADRVVARVLSFKPMQLDKTWLTRQLQTAISLRERLIDADQTNTYRLVNAEGDQLPGLTIDRYADYLMVQLYCEGWRPHLKLITSVLQELLQPTAIYEKHRPRNTRSLEAKGGDKQYGQLLTGQAAPARVMVRENGLCFLVSLGEGLDSGLFLDQRENRRSLRPLFAGQRFLNLFAYTGAFSVAAAAAGARQVTSVDLSESYTNWNRANFELNRINPKQHRFLVGDCQQKLTELTSAKERFDMILLDPPSFSTAGKGNKSKGRFTTRGGTSDLVAACLPLLQTGGLLICSSNHQKTDLADYIKELRRGALQAKATLQVIEQKGQPFDFPYPVTFPEGRYLKYLVCMKG